MKTRYKYINFVKIGDAEWWCHNNKSNVLLGKTGFNLRWKCFEFYPQPDIAFTDDCLADIIDFMKQLEQKK